MNTEQAKKEKWLTRSWKWLDGKKTVIGTVIWAVAGGLKFIPAMKPYTEVLDFSMEVGYAISIGGISHKALKSETGKKVINKLLKK